MQTKIEHWKCVGPIPDQIYMFWPDVTVPKIGDVYTMREIFDGPRFKVCYLNEIVNVMPVMSRGQIMEPWWPLHIFRKLEPVKIDIKIKAKEPELC